VARSASSFKLDLSRHCPFFALADGKGVPVFSAETGASVVDFSKATEAN